MLEKAVHYQPADVIEFRGVSLAARFSDLAAEYDAARKSAVVLDRRFRGLVSVRGPDRKTWLHNLVTNAVKDLDQGAGNYAFAIDVKGRTLFDLNILSLADELWLDVDAGTVARALAHLDRYRITEKVELRNVSADWVRLGCTGPDAPRIAADLGVTNLSPMASLASAQVAPDGSLLVRHDFAGMTGFELIVPAAQGGTWWDRLAGPLGAAPAGVLTGEVLRIEAAIPEWPADIDDKVIPPETGQVERGISYHKGCYLGQEVIERLRSLGAPARKLVRLTADTGVATRLPAPLLRDGVEVGRVTSLIRHPRKGTWCGLGYLKSALATPVELCCPDSPAPITASAARA